MPILAPFEAFARDAQALNVMEDESRLPVRWLAAAQVASRLADARPGERKTLLKTWVRQQAEDGPDGVWSALAVPGIPVRDLPTASTALCAIAADMERGGAFNLAYATVTNLRIAMLETGPASARGLATLQQARVLRQMGLLEEAYDTYDAAREDAIRARDRELEGRALQGLSVVAGHRGNYPDVIRLGTQALELLPENSEYAADGYATLMVAAMATRNFPAAFEYGWRGYDAAADDSERRAGMIANLASLAFRCGRFRAARRAFLATLNLTTVERVRLPALGGLSLVAAAQGALPELRQVANAIARESAISTQPYELARVRFELAQAWKETGELEEAEESLARARDLAAAHGFHEVSFRTDALAEAIAASRNAARKDLEASLARFEELHADESVLVGA